MKTMKVGELVFDFNLYPRIDVDAVHLGYIKEAIEAGNSMPPIVIDRASKRVADGFHRGKGYLSIYGPEHEIEVLEKNYKSEADILSDAIRLNAHHGRTLTRYDRVHCILLAEKFGIAIDETAKALGMTIEKLGELRADRVGTISIAGKHRQPTALKQTIRHMAGKSLNAGQVEANKKLSGMNQMFYVNQIITLIEADLLDAANAELVSRLKHLGSLIRGLKGLAA